MDGSDGWMAMKGTDSSVEKSLEYREIWRGKDENHEANPYGCART